MTLLKKSDVKSFADIEDDMNQVWHHEFRKKVSKNVIVQKWDEGDITTEDLKVAQVLLHYRFATPEQLYDAVDFERKLSFEAFKERLEELLLYRIVNAFGLTIRQGEHELDLDEDYVIYCLDVGGQGVLTHHIKDERLLDWLYIENVVSSAIVAHDLMVTEMERRFKKTNPAHLKYFKPSPELKLGRKTMFAAFEMLFEQQGHELEAPKRKYVVGEIMRKQEAPTTFRDKVNKWNKLLKEDYWRRYYGGSDATKPPILLVYAADDETAYHAAKILYETGDISNFRITTEERAKRPLYDKGVFMKYKPEKQQPVLVGPITDFKSKEMLEK